MEATDEQLMAAYRSGDRGAFDALYARYGGIVFGRMRRGTGSLSDARDLAQQVFLQLHRARRDYREGQPLRPWLMTIARNVLRDHLRRLRRRLPMLPLVEEPAADAPGGDRVEIRELVHDALARLAPDLRVVVRSYWLEHRSHAWIARELGISRGAVKVRAHRAYRALRRILLAKGVENP